MYYTYAQMYNEINKWYFKKQNKTNSKIRNSELKCMNLSPSIFSVYDVVGCI